MVKSLKFLGGMGLLLILSSIPASGEDSPVVVLEPAKGRFSKDAVVVKVTIDNQGKDPSIIYPVFTSSLTEGPETVVRFEVLDPQGNQLEPEAGVSLPGLRQEPSGCHFLELPPHWFFGARFDLTKGLVRYRFSKAGTYRVRATLSFRAKDWIRTKLLRGKSNDPKLQSLMTSLSLFLDGPIQTNEVLVTIN